MESSANHTHTGDPNSAKTSCQHSFFNQFLSSNSQCQGLKACQALLSNEAKPMSKTIRSLKHSFQSCTALPGFSQVQSEPSRKLDQCDKQSHLDLSIPFQAQFKQFYQFLDHVKYELLNQDELQQVKYQEATIA